MSFVSPATRRYAVTATAGGARGKAHSVGMTVGAILAIVVTAAAVRPVEAGRRVADNADTIITLAIGKGNMATAGAKAHRTAPHRLPDHTQVGSPVMRLVTGTTGHAPVRAGGVTRGAEPRFRSRQQTRPLSAVVFVATGTIARYPRVVNARLVAGNQLTVAVRAEDFAVHERQIGPVGIVAGAARGVFKRCMEYRFVKLRQLIRMTAGIEAGSLLFRNQQAGPLSAVGLVATGTIARYPRVVSARLVVSSHPTVAIRTEGRAVREQQIGLVGSVWRVAGAARGLFKGCVGYRLVKLRQLGRMTIETGSPLILNQQAKANSLVETVAIVAVAGTERLVLIGSL